MRRRRGLAVVALALLGSAPGCAGGGRVDCTLIGCDSGVSAEVRGDALQAVTGPFVARLCADDVCTETPVQPAQASSVHLFHMVPGGEADQQVSVRVELEQDGVVLLRHEREVRLRAERPNGPRCGPVCHQRGLVIDQS